MSRAATARAVSLQEVTPVLRISGVHGVHCPLFACWPLPPPDFVMSKVDVPRHNHISYAPRNDSLQARKLGFSIPIVFRTEITEAV
jgi:hypothetical protein